MTDEVLVQLYVSVDADDLHMVQLMPLPSNHPINRVVDLLHCVDVDRRTGLVALQSLQSGIDSLLFYCHLSQIMVAWHSSSIVRHMNEVTLQSTLSPVCTGMSDHLRKGIVGIPRLYVTKPTR